MTRLNYEAIAAALHSARDKQNSHAERDAVDLSAQYIANVMAADNPRFDRERFVIAAVGGGEVTSASCQMCGAPSMGRRYGYTVCHREDCHEQARDERAYVDGGES